MSDVDQTPRSDRTPLAARTTWQALVAAAATVYAAVVPLDLVMDFDPGHPVLAVLWIAPLVFLVDLVATAWAFKHRKGAHVTDELVTRPRWRWLLWADLVAALSLGTITGVRFWSLLGLAKLSKVSVYMHRWRRQHLRQGSRLLLVYTVYWLSLSGHWISCGWLALRGAEPRPAAATAYLDAVYWTITTLTSVGYGDITPESPNQKLFAILTMIIGLAFLGYIVGVVASALGNRDPATARFADNIERLGEAARYWKLPQSLERRIYEYHWYVWHHRLGYDESDFLRTLPTALRSEVTVHIKSEVLQRVALFKDADEAFLRDVSLRLRPRVLIPGEHVIEAGDPGDEMFFVVRGELEVLMQDGTPVSTMGDGDFFGEIALFTDAPRSATVVALTYCDAYVLSRTSFQYIARKYPGIRARMEARALERASRTQRDRPPS